jgi:hypothetical protein
MERTGDLAGERMHAKSIEALRRASCELQSVTPRSLEATFTKDSQRVRKLVN